MSLAHRANNITRDVSSSPEWGTAYSVTAYPVGAVATGASSGTQITVAAGHSIAVGDKLLINPGTDNTFTAAVDTVTATLVNFATETYSISIGDSLLNLGPDTGTSAPNYDANPMEIFTNPDASTTIAGAAVTCDSIGNYDFWHRGAGRFWELVKDSAGAIQGVVRGHQGDSVFNVADFGARGDGSTDNTSRIQAALDAVDDDVGGSVFVPVGEFNVSNLTYGNETTLYGLGKGSRLTHTGSAKMIEPKVVSPSFTSRFLMRDLYLNLTTTTTHAVSLERAFQSRLENITIVGNGSTGIGVYFNGAKHYNVCDQVHVFGSFGGQATMAAAFQTRSSANEQWFVNCRSSACVIGFDLFSDGSGGNNCKIRRAAFEQTTTGVKVGGTQNRITECRFENTTTGIEIVAGALQTHVESNSYSGSLFVDNGTSTFKLNDSDGDTEVENFGMTTGGVMTTNIGLNSKAINVDGVSDANAGLTIRFSGTAGDPESSITAGPGSLRLRSDGGVKEAAYLKLLGTGTTGYAEVQTIQAPVQLEIDGATPSVAGGNVFYTANTTATITNLTGGIDGETITIIFEDANTTVDFTANANMIGNGGVDLVAAVGDHMRCTLRGTVWYCSVELA